MNICILCPFFNEKDFLLEFLESISKQTLFNNNNFIVRVILIDGKSTDGSTELLNNFIDNKRFFHLTNEERYVSNALNLAIDFSKKFKPQYLVRMDMHSTYPSNYLDILINGIENLRNQGVKVGNYGGIVNTIPSVDNMIGVIIAKSLSSKFGMGSSIFRTGATQLKSVDTVPFGCFPIEIFNKIGNFDTDLIRNQDDEFNGRIIKAGYKIFLDPNIKVDYYARDSFKKIYKMFYQYGYFKPFVNKKLGKPSTLRQFIPPLFVLSIFISTLLILLNFSFIILLFTIYTLYTFLFYLKDVKPYLNKFSFLWFFNSYMCLFIIHFSYGYGYIIGVKDLFFKNAPDLVNSSR